MCVWAQPGGDATATTLIPLTAGMAVSCRGQGGPGWWVARCRHTSEVLFDPHSFWVWLHP